MRVAVLGGGPSGEHDVSQASAAAVGEGLAEAGHDPVHVLIGRDGAWSSGGDPVTLTPGAGLLGCDAVFPALHGPYGEDGTVQGLLETVGVPYVGAGVTASAVCMDKVLFKDLMGAAGFAQVDYVGLREGDDLAAAEALGFPLFVKPARLGSSVGISKVESAADLPGALAAAFAHDPLVIAEAMSHGLEIELSVLGSRDPETSEPGQIVIEADWYDYEAKYTPGGMELRVPAPLPPEVAARVRAMAVDSFLHVGCEGLARADFFVEDPDGDARVLLNELNTMPGFTPTSVYAKLFEAAGLAYPALLDRLLALALERARRSTSLT